VTRPGKSERPDVRGGTPYHFLSKRGARKRVLIMGPEGGEWRLPTWEGKGQVLLGEKFVRGIEVYQEV